MCGIAGIIGSATNSAETRTRLALMTDAIAHRGPDGEGHWLSDSGLVALGHRRLSILDLSDAGSQPMHIEQYFSIVFNGEIYNYVEIKEQLEREGVRFRSSSDTEVLLHLYAREGADCLRQLDGMFALAIWDHRKGELFCARDRFGEKPFFFAEYNGEFLFASEMKALWAAGVPKHISDAKLERFVRHGKVDVADEMNETMFQGISRLDAAHYLTWKEDRISINRYWSVDEIEENEEIKFDQATERFKELFKQSVSRRLRSDVPVGSSLSGGLDSSAVVCMVNDLKPTGQVQHTFSARFKDFSKDEGRFMELVNSQCQRCEPHYIFPEDLGILDLLPTVIHHQEEPFGSSSILAQWAVMKLAREQQVVVLLDGQGADEYLAGYGNEVRIYLYELFHSDKKRYRDELAAFNEKQPADKQIKPFESQENLRMKLGRYRRRIAGSETNVLGLRSRLKKLVATAGLKELLRYADRSSMAHSREVRLPFLSHELVEFSLSLPEEYLIKDGWTKYVLRHSMSDLVPKDVTWRKDKTGFEPPQSRWMEDPEIEDIVANQQKQFDITEITVHKYTNDMRWRLLLSAFI